MQTPRGLFITIEGIEGVGKSTNIDVIKRYLTDKKVEFVVTREPGGTFLAEKIRELLVNVHVKENLTELSELLLIFASRAQHLETLIKPTLAKGIWVFLIDLLMPPMRTKVEGVDLIKEKFLCLRN